MAKSRLRSSRVPYKSTGKARHNGWSRTKTAIILVLLGLLIGFSLFVLISLVLLH